MGPELLKQIANIFKPGRTEHRERPLRQAVEEFNFHSPGDFLLSAPFPHISCENT